MTITEMIKQLEELRENHGDLPVLIGAKKGYRCQTFSCIEVGQATMMREDFICIGSDGLDDALFEDVVY